jgi:membrane dipeptidase
MHVSMRPILTFVLSLPWLVRPIISQQEPLGEHDPFYKKAIEIMEKSPLLDTHVDLPQIIRSLGWQYKWHLITSTTDI